MLRRKGILREWEIFKVIKEIFERVTLKNDASLNFLENQGKKIDTIFKNLVNSNSMSKEMHKSAKPIGIRPGTIYDLFKVGKQEIDGFPSFRLTLSALQTPAYNLAKSFVPILNTLTKYVYTVKNSFHLTAEIREQDPSITMGSLGVDLFLTNIAHDETIDVYINQLFEDTDTGECFAKS